MPADNATRAATRDTVALALRESHVNGSLSGYRTYVGLASGKGRDETNAPYECALTSTKIIVTCNPWRWEGDARTMEAMASGALVLVDRMLLPPPGVAHAQGVLFYNSTGHLLHLLNWALQHPRQADAIAKEGMAATQTTVDMVEYMMRTVLSRTPGLRVPVRLYVVPIFWRYQQNEFLLTLDGLNRSKMVALQENASDADALYLDLWRIYNLCGKYCAPYPLGESSRCRESACALSCVYN
jgi:hypothetical protein